MIFSSCDRSSGSQQSSHGKWTLSSSDEESEDSKKPSSSLSVSRDRVVPAPQFPCSEARKESYKRKSNPVKFEEKAGKEPSPAKKIKSEKEGMGWCLSSSDEEPEPKKEPNKLKEPSSQKPEVQKVHKSRSPTPTANEKHKTPSDSQDPWDVLQAGEPFRFYLTKVTGIKPKYNAGALHIKGESLTGYF